MSQEWREMARTRIFPFHFTANVCFLIDCFLITNYIGHEDKLVLVEVLVVETTDERSFRQGMIDHEKQYILQPGRMCLASEGSRSVAILPRGAERLRYNTNFVRKKQQKEIWEAL